MRRSGNVRSVSSLLRVVLVVVVAVSAAMTLNGGAATARTAVEPSNYAAYQPQVSCDPTPKPGVLAFRDLMHRKFGGGDLGIARPCGIGGLSEHKEGRAWDYGMNAFRKADRARAHRVITWLTKEVHGVPAQRARRLGVMYMIWNHRIWSSYLAGEGWRKYTGSDPHTNHIHISFTWNGATKRTSWWTGEVEPFDYGPCTKWVGELAHRWSGPRLAPCPVAIKHPHANNRGIYRAQPGETVGRVARFFDRSQAKVRRWNDFPKHGHVDLYVGQRLHVTRP